MIRRHVLVIFSAHSQTDEYGSSAISLLTFNLSSVLSYFSFPFNLFAFLPALYTMPFLQEQITWTELICLILTFCQFLLINCYVMMVSGVFSGWWTINLFLKHLYRNSPSLWHDCSLSLCVNRETFQRGGRRKKSVQRENIIHRCGFTTIGRYSTSDCSVYYCYLF